MDVFCSGVPSQGPYDLPEDVAPILDAEPDPLVNRTNVTRQPMIKLTRLTDEVRRKLGPRKR